MNSDNGANSLFFDPREQKRLHDMFMRLSAKSGAVDVERLKALEQIEIILSRRGLNFGALADNPEWIFGSGGPQLKDALGRLEEALEANRAFAEQNEAIRKENEELRARKENEAVSAYGSASYDRGRIGQLIEDKGIYLTRWSPVDPVIGTRSKRLYDIYAFPFDFGKDERGRGSVLHFTFNEFAKRLSLAGSLMGHKILPCTNDKQVFEFLERNLHLGNWFIPPLELLNGKNECGYTVNPDNLFSQRATGGLSGTFARYSHADSQLNIYWSSTSRSGTSEYVRCVAGFEAGDTAQASIQHNTGYLRLVRAEEVSGP